MIDQPRTQYDDVENHLLRTVKKDFDYAKAGKVDLERKVQEWRRMFNCRYQAATLTQYGQSLLYIPKATATILRMHSAMFSNYFKDDEFAKITAVNQKGATPIAAKIRTETLKWHFRNSIDPMKLMDRSIMDTLVDSTCCLKAGWKRRYNSQGTMIENKLTSDVIPLEDVFWDPDARTDDEIRWVIHEKEVDPDYLREMALDPETGYDPIAVERIIHKANAGQSTIIRDTAAAPENQERKIIKIWECWFKSLQMVPDSMLQQIEYQQGPTEATRAQPVVITTYENSEILRGPELNPYGQIPFFFGRVLTDKPEKRNTVAGKGPMSMFAAIQNEINAIRNQRRVAAKRSLQGRIVIERGAGFDMEQLQKYREAGIIYVNKAEGVKDFKVSDPSVAFDRELITNQNDFQEASGVTNEVQGMRAGGGKETATAVNRRTELALNRLGTMMATFNMSYVQPWIRFCDKLCGMNETREHVTIIMGADPQDPRQMVPELSMIWNAEVNVKIEAGVNVITSEQELQEINMVVQTWMPLVQFLPEVSIPLLIGLAKRTMHTLPGDFKAEEQQVEMAMGAQGQAAPTPGQPPGPGPEQRGTFAGPGAPRSTPPGTIGPQAAHAEGGMRNAAA